MPLSHCPTPIPHYSLHLATPSPPPSVKLTMKNLRKEYETNMVGQNGCNNDLAVQALSLEKKLACLEDENLALTKEKDSNAIVMQRLEVHNVELLQQLKAMEDERKEAECVLKESTLVMEEQLKGYQTQLAEARQEAAEQQAWEDRLQQVGTVHTATRDMHTHVQSLHTDIRDTCTDSHSHIRII